MTLAHRREKNTKGGSVIAGLRMEPALAEKLVVRAHEHAAGGLDEGQKANIAETARTLLRNILRVPAGQKLSREKNTQLAGLRCEPALLIALEKMGTALGLNRAGTARHLLRLALGWTPEASLEIEDRFAVIAEAKKGLMEKS